MRSKASSVSAFQPTYCEISMARSQLRTVTSRGQKQSYFAGASQSETICASTGIPNERHLVDRSHRMEQLLERVMNVENELPHCDACGW